MLGTVALTVAKTIENMEMGHNIGHGQWDWMNDPEVDSSTWEWDMAGSSSQWRYSHNYRHHVFTNVIGMDDDLGFGVMRVAPDHPWKTSTLLQPLRHLPLGITFEWGIALLGPPDPWGGGDADRGGQRIRRRPGSVPRCSRPLGRGRVAAALMAADLAALPLLDLLDDDLQFAATDPDSTAWTHLHTLARAEVGQASGPLIAQLNVGPAQALMRLRTRLRHRDRPRHHRPPTATRRLSRVP